MSVLDIPQSEFVSGVRCSIILAQMANAQLQRRNEKHFFHLCSFVLIITKPEHNPKHTVFHRSPEIQMSK
jgi:hypothetical protein